MKILPTSWLRIHKNKLDAMEAKQFWSKIWEQKEHYRKAE